MVLLIQLFQIFNREQLRAIMLGKPPLPRPSLSHDAEQTHDGIGYREAYQAESFGCCIKQLRPAYAAADQL